MSAPASPLLAGIEAGGTKFVLAVGSAPSAIAASHTIATRAPGETLAEAAAWFATQGAIRALGIASFGPVELDRASPRWGRILATPKPGWLGCDLAGTFAGRLGVPVALDTDVNGAALAEFALGAGVGAASLAYITVGTGIGGGIVERGVPAHGAAHPEMGHTLPRRHPDDRAFAGVCPYHGDCLEGLASGPAILARWGAQLSDLPPAHPAHGIVAHYLAQLCHAAVAFTAAEVVVLGGGVMHTPGLLDAVRREAARLDAGYFPGGERHRIVAPMLGSRSGVTGALLLAERAVARPSP